ncbi:MAG: substrate-binding domain-containing protein [Victivallaceae bacterium]|nr:substrate-binding domain-containing protein [Victivallaceae bacterium]
MPSQVSRAQYLIERLRKDIETMEGEAKLPSFRKMMNKYDVSQLVLTQAINYLEFRGLVQRRPNIGVFRCARPDDTQLQLGLLSTDWPSPLLNELEENLRELAAENNAVIKRFSFPFNSKNIFDYLPLRELHAVMVMLRGSVSLEMAEQIHRIPIPVLLSGEMLAGIELNWIISNSLKNGLCAADVLIRDGRKKLAVLLSEPTSDVCSRRLEGFRMMAKSHNLPVELLDVGTKCGEDSRSTTRKFLGEYFSSGRSLGFDGLYLICGSVAEEIVGCFAEHKIQIPREVGLISADCDPHCRFVHPRINSIDIDYREYAQVVLSSFQKLFADPDSKIQIELDNHVSPGGSLLGYYA